MATKEVTPYLAPVVSAAPPAVTPKDPASKATAKVRAKKTESAPAAEAHPWDEIPEEATQTYVVALPAKLHCKLKWLGGMTWGSSMRKIAIQALEAEADRLLKAKGIGK